MLKRKFAVLLSALILVLSLYIGASLEQQYVETEIKYGAQPTIIIDAGHAALRNIIKIKREFSIKHYQASKKPAI